MSDRKRIRFTGIAMTAFCILLLPLVWQIMTTEGAAPSTWQQQLVLGLYVLSLVCGPCLVLGVGVAGTARLATLPFLWTAYYLVRALIDAASSEVTPVREMAGTAMVMQACLTLGFCLLVCAEIIYVLALQDGTVDRLDASTPLPSAITARLYGGVLVLSFASVLMSSDQQVGMALELAGIPANMAAIKISMFLMFGGGLLLLLTPTSPLTAAACRILSCVQAMFALWVVYCIYDMMNRMFGGSAELAAVMWKQLSAMLAMSSVPVVFTWAVGDEVVPEGT